jgi:hypothetical protein
MRWINRVAVCVTLVGIGAALGCVPEDHQFNGTGGGGSTSSSQGAGGDGSSSPCKLGSSLVGNCVLQ